MAIADWKYRIPFRAWTAGPRIPGYRGEPPL
jgi:hypothetical protein